VARFLRPLGRSGPIDLPVDATVTAQLEVFVPPVVTVLKHIGQPDIGWSSVSILEVEGVSPLAIPIAIGVDVQAVSPPFEVKDDPADEEAAVESGATIDVQEVTP
jgi:hypothetical protein